ncbi:hypothetical protein EBME_0068 [bacterium endosymbiont of Mortierella elongata FMR23-6]|nr:hypothetical protein EBME_0068 [bacterium endosymbiont of Mortierella elongata FMR23-6]
MGVGYLAHLSLFIYDDDHILPTGKLMSIPAGKNIYALEGYLCVIFSAKVTITGVVCAFL